MSRDCHFHFSFSFSFLEFSLLISISVKSRSMLVEFYLQTDGCVAFHRPEKRYICNFCSDLIY